MTERNRDGRPAKGRRLIIGAACLGLLMLAAVCFVCLDTNTTSADPDSGTCGENLTWEFDGVDTLTISGSGPMEDYSSKSTPWGDYSDVVTTLVIGDGVTSVSGRAFPYFTHLTSLTLGSGIQTIGDSAFVRCPVTVLTIPDSVVSIGRGAFESVSVSTLNLGSGVTTIGDYAFGSCESLTALTLPDSVTSVGEGAFSETGLTTLTVGRSEERRVGKEC